MLRIVIRVEVDHVVVVVVVLRKTGDGHGVLSLHALAARATVEAGVGQKLNASVLLCLEANLEVFNDLGLKFISEEECHAKECSATDTKDASNALS